MIMKRRREFLRSFCAGDDGVTAIEFAFIAPMLLMFTFGIMEFAFVFLANNVLENAANEASRMGKTGYIAAQMTREAYLKKIVSDRIDGLMDPDLLTMTTKVYKGFDDVGKPEPFTDANTSGMYDYGEVFNDTNGNGQWDSDMGGSGQGDERDVVVYDFNYPWKYMTPFIGNILSNDGITIGTRIVIRNEPFNDESEL